MRAGILRWIIVGLLVVPCAALAYRIAADVVPAVGGWGGSNGSALHLSGGLSVAGRANNSSVDEIAGFWFGPRGSQTGIASPAVPLTPAVTQLERNFPNPFNPRTTFKFQVAGGIGEATPTRLAIYDVSGRCMAVLIDAELLPGYYTGVWNGTDAGGRQVASGVYLARFTAGAYAKTIRTVVTR